MKLLSLGAISKHTPIMHTPAHITYALRDLDFVTVNAMHTPVHIAYALRGIVFVTVNATHASLAS